MSVTWMILGAVLLTGLLGGVHCVGMCGGIVTALVAQSADQVRPWTMHLAYNFGRIASYALAGAVAGAIGSMGLLFNRWLPIQLFLFVAANVLLIALGFYLSGIGGPIVRLEHLGAGLWRYIHPLTRRFLPANSVPKALALGILWGWLPCGLVYTVLFTAFLSGSATKGAIVMLVFGFGTLPNLMATVIFLRQSQLLLAGRWVRIVSGMAVAAFGVVGLAHAVDLGDQIKRGLLCIL